MNNYLQRIQLLSADQKRLLVQKLHEHGYKTPDGGVTNQQLVAYVVSDLPQAEVGVLRTALQSQLPAHMLPAAFVVVEALPMTPSGKVDRKALAARPLNGAGQGATDAGFVAPRTPVEKQLAVIWATVLGVDQVGVNTDFFAAGGHSLLALNLMHQIQQQFGVSLPLATLFQAPTIAQLAHLLVAATTPHAWSPLVPIRPQGKLPPLFCVHGVGGHVFNLAALAHALPQEQPFYGLQACGLDGKTPPHTSVEAMAAAYVAAIQTVQPHGPYSLGGHSFGGEIVFEMAQQLQQQGERVALLALLDSYAPGVIASVLAGLDEGQQADWLQAQLQLAALLPQEVASQQAQGIHQVVQANLQIRYQPGGPLAVPAVLFRASETPQPLPTTLDATLGWQAWFPDGIEIQAVPGDHFTMLAEPHVQTLAAKLRAQLTQAHQRS